jgi:hypothetical protein
MTPAANTLLPLIIVSLGLLGVILAFLVPDRKKYLISLSLAGLIVFTGVVQLASQSISRFRLNRRMAAIQRERAQDLEDIRKRLQEQQGTNAKPGQGGTTAKPASAK